MNTFIEFISYLYHAEIQIKIVDAVSMIEFGETYCKLRDIIRMRRNETQFNRECWVVKEGRLRAKLKL